MAIETKSSTGSIEIDEGLVAPGEFPFRITEGGESRYLKWIRDHSNYMAVRGWSDYFRAGGVLVRGALVNFLIVLPVLLVTAVAVAGFKVWLYDVPFIFTQLLVGVTALAFASFPARTFLAKFANYRRSQETGADSSVKQRDTDERRVGLLLIAVVAVAVVETLPILLDPFHVWTDQLQLELPELGSVVAAGLAVLSGAGKILSVLPRVASGFAKAALGLLGLLLPLFVVLSVAEYLSFGPPVQYWAGYAGLAAWSLPVLMLGALGVGCVRGAFSLRGMLVMSLLVIGSARLASEASNLDEYLSANLSEPADRLTKSFHETQPHLSTDLVREVARQAGPSFGEVQRMIKEVQDTSMERTRLDEEPALSDPPLAASLQLHLSSLSQAKVPEELKGELDELVKTVRTAVKESPDDAIKIEVGVSALTQRVASLEQLFVPRDAESLLKYISTLSNSRLDELGNDDPKSDFGSIDDEKYARLHSIASVELLAVLKSLGALSRELSDARWEITHSAHAAIGSNTSDDFITEMRSAAFPGKALGVFVVALTLWGFCMLTVDVNLTSIHGLYRDRLASAFLIGSDTEGDVDIEGDIDLGDLSCHEAGSIAPYHLINVALNLQASSDIGLRDRKSDFFIFSKKFTGGKRTGYCRSESMERVYPQMSLASAMAISAAAASPNMGRGTSPALVALMAMLNIRLGIWVPNPGLLQQKLDRSKSKSRARARANNTPPGFSFETVFSEELAEVQARWRKLPGPAERHLAEGTHPTVQHGLYGIAFSGGGIRSAAVNLGIVQMLEHSGAFRHVDYMSTVSGGGYLGSSISALMRRKTRTESEFAGRVSVQNDQAGDTVVSILSARKDAPIKREYRYSKEAKLAVKHDQSIKAGQRLLRTETDVPSQDQGFWKKYWMRRSFGEQFSWQVPSRALLWEMMGWLDEKKRWVNLSDGGHIENLAAIELLRRHCKYIVIGDGEADPEHGFNGLATLIRTARLDLGVDIDIDTKALRLRKGRCDQHWVGGRIIYPNEDECGYLLYLKSSITGDEDEVIREYRHAHPSFPHESTADQMFNEAQFEAYRSLGQHIAEQPLYHAQEADKPVERRDMSYVELGRLFETLCASEPDGDASNGDASVRSPSVSGFDRRSASLKRRQG